MTNRLNGVWGGLLLVSMLVAACAPVQSPAAPPPTATANEKHAATGYPVTIENCGNTLTFDKAPARVASLYSVTTELLLRLGLEAHIVAAANFGEPLPADLQAAYQGLNLIGEGFIIPKEVLLSQKPDLVMDNQPDWFYSAENGFATVAEITGSGAQIYSITAKCGGGRVDAQFEDIYTDIRNMGKIFGVSDQAEAFAQALYPEAFE